MKSKLLSFFGVFLYVMAVVGGIGHSIYSRYWSMVVAIVVLGIMAWPQFRKCFKNLLNV